MPKLPRWLCPRRNTKSPAPAVPAPAGDATASPAVDGEVRVRGDDNRVAGAGAHHNTFGDNYFIYGQGASVAGYRAGEAVDRCEALTSMAGQSRGRLIARWMAAGLEEQLAADFADDPAVGQGPAALGPLPDRGLVLLEGEFGSGKSVTAERLHQADVAAAVADPGAPAPVYLDAQLVDGLLSDAVWRETGPVADTSVVGVRLVLDGLDGVSLARAQELLDQARSLIQRQPACSRIVATARPGLPDVRDNERVTYPPLSSDEADALARRISGHPSWAPVGSQQVQDALLLPLFVIIAALLQGEGRSVPSSRIDFLDKLVERALRRSGADHPDATAALTHLARLTIQAGGPVPASEAGNQAEISALLATRLLLRRGRTLAFGLPVLEQYFGGHSVLEDGLPQGTLDRAVELERWRYPLALALTASSWEQACSLLQPITSQHPGLAAWLLHEGIPDSRRGSHAAAPSPAQAGERVHLALTALLPGLSPASSLLKITTPSGAPPRLLGVYAVGHELVTAAHPTAGTGDSAGVRVLKELNWETLREFHGPDGSAHTGHPPVDYPAWPWRWCLDWMSQQLTPLLQDRQLHGDLVGPALDERRWQLCRAVSGQSSVLLRPIDAAEVVEALRHMTGVANLMAHRFSNGLQVTGVDLRALLVELESGQGIAEDDHIHCPFPIPDLPPGSSPWVYGHYSDQRLTDFASYIHTAALRIYQDLCERWFPHLIPSLGLACILPVHISGHVSRDDNRGFVPHEYSYDMQPMPPGTQSTATFTFRATGTPAIDWPALMERGAQIRRAIQRLHAESVPWAHPRSALSVFPSPSDTPATRVAYRWLWEDLQALRIVSGPVPQN